MNSESLGNQMKKEDQEMDQILATAEIIEPGITEKLEQSSEEYRIHKTLRALEEHSPGLRTELRVLAAVEEIEREERNFRERLKLALPVLFAILLVSLLKPGLIPNEIGYINLIFIFISRFNLAGLFGSIAFFFSQDIALATLSFMIGLILSSPKLIARVLGWYGKIKQSVRL